MCSIADDLGISFQLPTIRFALLTFKLTFFNLTEHFNDRTQASNIFQQLSLSSFVIINMGHSGRSPRQLHSSVQPQQEHSTMAASQYF